MAVTLRVVSLNCWGLKYISKLRHERLAQIGRELAAADPAPEIVGLQECWVQADYEAIRAATRDILPYGKFYYSGVFGGGLAILSKWPIQESSMIPYKLNGRPQAFWRGDWYVGKGVACAGLTLEDGRMVDVYTTHLHAPYEKEPNDSYLCHRTAQAWEISKLMRRSYEAGNLVLALGDFNMLPLSLAHKLISTHGRVNDVWRMLLPDSSVGAAQDKVEQERGVPIPTAKFNVEHNGATCDSILNTWRWNKRQQRELTPGKDMQIVEDDVGAKRLDYIFVGDSRREWFVQSANVGMMMRHSKLGCSLSDHFSVETTLCSQSAAGNSDHDPTTKTESTQNALQASTSSLLPVETYESILDVIDKYVKRELSQRRWRLGHFIASIPISIACLIGVWWSPHNYVAFILMLVSTLSLAAGVIDGLIGGLFTSAELRSLKEFRWEIENAKSQAAKSYESLQ